MTVPRGEKSDWTDLDLLTRSETGDRLDGYIAAADATLEQLRSDPDATPAAVAMAARRADAMRESARRIRER